MMRITWIYQQQQARHTIFFAVYQHPYIPHRVCESQELSSSPKDNCVIGVFCCCIWLPVLVFESVWQQSDGVPRRSELPRKSVAFESELWRNVFWFFFFEENKRFSRESKWWCNEEMENLNENKILWKRRTKKKSPIEVLLLNFQWSWGFI